MLFVGSWLVCPSLAGVVGDGFWSDVILLPGTPKSVPEDAPPPLWKSSVNVLGIVQVQDDLGRQLAVELDRLSRRNPGDFCVAIFSLDISAHEWPRPLISDFHRSADLELPIYSLSPEDTARLYRGFDPRRMRVLPQVLLFNDKKGLLKILRGVHRAEEVEEAIREVRQVFLPLLPAKNEIRSTPELVKNVVQNGGFEKWEGAPSVRPEGWNVLPTSGETIFKRDQKGWNLSTALEIRNAPRGGPQIVHQILPVESLAGKRVRLSAWVKSNCLGKPVIVLAKAARRRDPRHRFVPVSPIRTRSGKKVPLQILAACDFTSETASWKHLSSETTLPEQVKALAVLVYLENPSAAGGAALLDEVRLEILDE